MSTQTAGSTTGTQPGEFHVHLALAWDEAQRGCTRVVEVDGRLEWLDIPPGATDGQEITFPGRGHVGEGDRRGDLRVSLEVGPEPVPGEEIGVKLLVSPLEALTGGRKTVEVNGRLVWVRIPPNVTAGQVIRMKGEGGHGEHGGPRGDLVVVLEIADSLTIPEFEPDEETVALAPQSSVVPYAPAPPRSQYLWPVATVLAAAVVGGVALKLFTRAEGEASAATPPAPLPPITQPVATPAPAPASVVPPVPGAPTPVSAPAPAPKPAAKPPARKAEPPAPRPERPVARRSTPARTARQPRANRTPPRRQTVRAARPAPAPRTVARFCGRCGRRIAGGSFCGGCGRKI